MQKGETEALTARLLYELSVQFIAFYVYKRYAIIMPNSHMSTT